MTSPNILVVESDNDFAGEICAWLAEGGYTDSMTCPRPPSAPDYTCLAWSGVDCPLARGADLVVLDLDLESDRMLEGTPSWELLLYYLEHGCNVVALSNADVLLRWLQDDRLVTIPKPRNAKELLDAIDALAHRSATRGDEPNLAIAEGSTR